MKEIVPTDLEVVCNNEWTTQRRMEQRCPGSIGHWQRCSCCHSDTSVNSQTYRSNGLIVQLLIIIIIIVIIIIIPAIVIDTADKRDFLWLRNW